MRVGAVHRGIPASVSVQPLLLLDLPEDGRSRRLRGHLGADASTLDIKGEEHIRSYRAKMHEPGSGKETRSSGERKFCGECGSALWLWDPTWPELVHPYASAIDTPLPTPPERTHFMLGSKASWVEPCMGASDQTFDGYPEESIAEWHQRLGLERAG